MTNSDIENAYDKDKLTNEELIDKGFPPRKWAKERKDICSICNKEVSQPITRYDWHGFPLLKNGEKAHKGCVQAKLAALIEFYNEIKGETNE